MRVFAVIIFIYTLLMLIKVNSMTNKTTHITQNWKENNNKAIWCIYEEDYVAVLQLILYGTGYHCRYTSTEQITQHRGLPYIHHFDYSSLCNNGLMHLFHYSQLILLTFQCFQPAQKGLTKNKRT